MMKYFAIARVALYRAPRCRIRSHAVQNLQYL